MPIIVIDVSSTLFVPTNRRIDIKKAPIFIGALIILNLWIPAYAGMTARLLTNAL